MFFPTEKADGAKHVQIPPGSHLQPSAYSPLRLHALRKRNIITGSQRTNHIDSCVCAGERRGCSLQRKVEEAIWNVKMTVLPTRRFKVKAASGVAQLKALRSAVVKAKQGQPIEKLKADS